jgi:hypothetical protein
MQRIYLREYPDSVGVVVHGILMGERYHLSGEYMWGELIWCLILHDRVNPRKMALLNLATSEYRVDTQTVRDWKDY